MLISEEYQQGSLWKQIDQSNIDLTVKAMHHALSEDGCRSSCLTPLAHKRGWQLVHLQDSTTALGICENVPQFNKRS